MDFSVGWFVRHGSYFFLTCLLFALCFWLACFVMNRRAVKRGWLKEGEVSWVQQPKPVKALLMGLTFGGVVIPLQLVFFLRYLEGPGDSKSPLAFSSSHHADVWMVIYLVTAILIFKFFLRASTRRAARLLLWFLLSHIPFAVVGLLVYFGVILF